MEQQTPDRQVAEQFNKAIASAADARAALDEARGDPFAYVRLLATVLAPFDEACANFHMTVDLPPDRAEPTQAEAAWLRASHVLEPLLDEREHGPLILTDQTVLLEKDGGILLQEQPAITDGPVPAGAPEDCCITSMVLTNLTGKRARLTLTHENGVQKGHVFDPGKTHTVTFRELAAGQADEEADDARTTGDPIPGGMGHCVTVSIQHRVGNRWVERVSKRICCDDNPHPQDGDIISEVRSLGGAPEHFSREPVFRIDRIAIERPCPNLPPAPPTTGQRGTAGSQGFKYEGTMKGGKHFYGAGCYLLFQPTNCRNFCFVQGKKRTAFLKRPGTTTEKKLDGLCTPGDDFKLDQKEGFDEPCYPFVQPTPAGGKVMRDGPGISEPWAPMKIDGLNAGSFPRGSILRIEWTFRTWVVCLDGDPVVLGHFDWSMTVIITIGRGPRDTTAQITPPDPKWRDDPDKDGYNKVAGQAQKHDGFIAP
jgi:hypothetical protein